MIAGLATITPASGNVGPMGAIAIGAIAAVFCYYAVNLIRNKFKIDDSLDVFAVHGPNPKPQTPNPKPQTPNPIIINILRKNFREKKSIDLFINKCIK